MSDFRSPSLDHDFLLGDLHQQDFLALSALASRLNSTERMPCVLAIFSTKHYVTGSLVHLGLMVPVSLLKPQSIFCTVTTTGLRLRLCGKEVCPRSRAGKLHLCDILLGTDVWRAVAMCLGPGTVCGCLCPYWTLCSATCSLGSNLCTLSSFPFLDLRV